MIIRSDFTCDYFDTSTVQLFWLKFFNLHVFSIRVNHPVVDIAPIMEIFKILIANVSQCEYVGDIKAESTYVSK